VSINARFHLILGHLEDVAHGNSKTGELWRIRWRLHIEFHDTPDTIGRWRFTVNDEGLKKILRDLVADIENLRANLEVVAAVAGHQKVISRGTAMSAESQAKASNQKHYDKLRKAIDELAS
jgi:hypothetical protein